MNNFSIRHRKIINLQLLTILLAVVLGGSQFADGQGSHINWLEIKNKWISGNNLHVSGECEISDQSKIWLLHHQRGSGISWNVQETTIRPTKNTKKDWQGKVKLDNKTDCIDIIAVTFKNGMEVKEIQRLLTGKSGDDLPKIGEETSNRARCNCESGCDSGKVR